MNTLMSKLTETENPFINSAVAVTVTFIVISAIALLIDVAINGAPNIGFMI